MLHQFAFVFAVILGLTASIRMLRTEDDCCSWPKQPGINHLALAGVVFYSSLAASQSLVVALVGVVVSTFLTMVQAVGLKPWCRWCLASAAATVIAALALV